MSESESPRLVKVTQVASSIGAKPKTRGTLRALRLGTIGDSWIHVDSPSLRGMLLRAGRWVKTEDVGEVDLGVRAISPNLVESAGQAEPISYEVPRLRIRGTLLRTSDGHPFRVEERGDSRAVGWLPRAEVGKVDLFRSLYEIGDNGCRISVLTRHADVFHPTWEDGVRQMLLHRNNHIDLVRIDSLRISAVWERSLRTGGRGELTTVFDAAEEYRAVSLMKATANETVVESVMSQLSEEFSR